MASVGLTKERKLWIRDFLKPFAGARILDIGCGTAEILRHLPLDVDYSGFDMSRAYIDAARRAHGARGRFVCSTVTASQSGGELTEEAETGGYDIAMAFGVLHHLDDGQARQVFRDARRALKPGGRLVTLDPAYIPNQTFLSRFVVSHDRGRNVRYREAYADLARESFSDIEATVLPRILRIPADNVVLVCRA